MSILQQTYLGDILHIISQVLLVPTIIGLILLIAYAVWCLGGFIVEWAREHRNFKVEMPVFLHEMHMASPEELPTVIKNSGLLGNQKRCLLTIWDYRCLPVDTHVALAKQELAELESLHTKLVNRTQTVSKIAPMLGLMGTLIPLGPGLVDLGVGDTQSLSSSLLVAFDTTVAGLVVALVTYTLTKVRSRWYESYMSALEAAVMGILEKVDAMREAGALDTTEPTNYAQEFAQYGSKEHKQIQQAQVATQAQRQTQAAAQTQGQAQVAAQAQGQACGSKVERSLSQNQVRIPKENQ